MQTDNDFPVLIDILDRYGVIFVATNSVNIHIYEITKGILIFKCKISEDSLLFSTHNPNTGGMMYINKSGKLLGLDIDKNNLLPFIIKFCKNATGVMEVVTLMAARFNLPGAETIFVTSFKNFMQQGNYQEAAKIAAQTPGDTLRSINTINMFKQLKGNPQPDLIYFQTMLSIGKLNKVESLELARLLVAQNRQDILNKMFNENKFTSSDELHELVKYVDQRLSIKILMASYNHTSYEKTIHAFAKKKNDNKIELEDKKKKEEEEKIINKKNIINKNISNIIKKGNDKDSNENNKNDIIKLEMVIKELTKRIKELEVALKEKDNITINPNIIFKNKQYII